ncbi:MAG: baseplate J/gp47 family protein, partial [Algicola sp.]|nr:baseplate J/gp47 family protein [Algicola sp.]
VLRQDLLRLRTSLASINELAIRAQGEYDNAYRQNRNYQQTVAAAQRSAVLAELKGVPYYPGVIPKPSGLPDKREALQEISQRQLPSPYTPSLDNIRFGYRASSAIDLRVADVRPVTTAKRPELPLDLYRYHPFGIRPMGQLEDSDDYMLPVYRQQGYFCLGVSRLVPGQTVNLLFQLERGSADPYLEPPQGQWAYLAGNDWLPLPLEHLLRDTTEHMQDSGLVQISLPDNASVDHTLMPSGRAWLRLEFGSNLAALPGIVSVRCQAALASFVKTDSNQARLASPLAANQINGLVSTVNDIDIVSQPYRSFGGMAAENAEQYFGRVAGHLQHKNRSLTRQDYETMVLARFPELYKVKCTPASIIREQRLLRGIDEPADGQDLQLFVVAKSGPQHDLLTTKPANIIDNRPNASKVLLRQIQHFVEQHKPALVQVAVSNPTYEELTYRLAVKFRAGKEKGFYTAALNQTLIRLLSPWIAKPEGVEGVEGADIEWPEINFGNRVTSAAVVRFIESLDYIDYVANFTLLQQVIRHADYIETVPLFLTDANQAVARQEGAILVSADQHIIDVIESEPFDASAFRGIGFMITGTDFWIERPAAQADIGLGELVIDEAQVSKRLLHQQLPEQNIDTLYQALLDQNYLTSQGLIGTAFNAELALSDFELEFEFELSADKETLYQLLLTRLDWQSALTPLVVI